MILREFMDNPVKRFYAFGPFIADLSNRRLSRGEEEVPLTTKDFELLFALLENAGRRVEKEELEQRIWPEAPSGDMNRLHRRVHSLRQAIGDGQNGAQYIETLTKAYRFVAEVKVWDVGDPSPEQESAPLPKETWREWLVRGMWRDLREGLGLIKEGFDTFFDAMSEAWNSGIGDGGSKVLRGFRKMWLPLILVVVITLLAWRLLVELKYSPGVRLAILLIALAVVVLEVIRRWKRRPPIRKLRSVAVLPLKNQNGSTLRPDFAQEVTGEIIRDLTKLGFMRVCNASDEGDLPLREIAGKLRVKGILRGNVEWPDEHVRINIEIIGWDGVTVLGSESFEEKLSNCLNARGVFSERLADWLLQRMGKKPLVR